MEGIHTEFTIWGALLHGQEHDFVSVHPPLADDSTLETLHGDVLTGLQTTALGVGFLEVTRGTHVGEAREAVISLADMRRVRTLGGLLITGSTHHEIARQFNKARQQGANRA